MSTPPLAACIRTLLPAIVTDPSRLPALFAFESTVLEVTFVLGPPLALGARRDLVDRRRARVRAGS